MTARPAKRETKDGREAVKSGKPGKMGKSSRSGTPERASKPPKVADLGASVLLAEELYRLVGRSRRLLWMSAARSLEARGRSIFTWQVLCYLVRNGATTQRDLAYANAQHPAGISRLLEELESEKLIRRAADPNDRRKLLVEPTAKGRAWLEAETPDVMSAVDIAMRELSRPQREDLRALLERLLAATEVPKVAADRS